MKKKIESKKVDVTIEKTLAMREARNGLATFFDTTHKHHNIIYYVERSSGQDGILCSPELLKSLGIVIPERLPSKVQIAKVIAENEKIEKAKKRLAEREAIIKPMMDIIKSTEK